jgi:hypothetical protein
MATIKLSPSQKSIQQSEFEMTHEQVGKILALAAEIGEPVYSTMLEFIQLYHSKEDAQAQIEDLEDVLDCEYNSAN